ncbi:MAG: hypothetical protein ACLU38_11200 [Dysosmobacter sp.]
MVRVPDLRNSGGTLSFHTSLHLTAPEKIVTEGTDLHLAAVHHAVCGRLYVDYIHLQADPEQGAGRRGYHLPHFHHGPRLLDAPWHQRR